MYRASIRPGVCSTGQVAWVMAQLCKKDRAAAEVRQ